MENWAVTELASSLEEAIHKINVQYFINFDGYIVTSLLKCRSLSLSLSYHHLLITNHKDHHPTVSKYYSHIGHHSQSHRHSS
jgi:hypothetical protein